MGPEVFVPFVFFAFLTAVIVIPAMARESTKRSAHQLVSQAIARGQELDPALVSQLTESIATDSNRARKSLGYAVVLLALTGGFVAAGYVMNGYGWDGHDGMLIAAIILGSIGVAYLLLAIIDYASKRRAA